MFSFAQHYKHIFILSNHFSFETGYFQILCMVNEKKFIFLLSHENILINLLINIHFLYSGFSILSFACDSPSQEYISINSITRYTFPVAITLNGLYTEDHRIEATQMYINIAFAYLFVLTSSQIKRFWYQFSEMKT